MKPRKILQLSILSLLLGASGCASRAPVVVPPDISICYFSVQTKALQCSTRTGRYSEVPWESADGYVCKSPEDDKRSLIYFQTR